MAGYCSQYMCILIYISYQSLGYFPYLFSKGKYNIMFCFVRRFFNNLSSKNTGPFVNHLFRSTENVKINKHLILNMLKMSRDYIIVWPSYTCNNLLTGKGKCKQSVIIKMYVNRHAQNPHTGTIVT